MDKKEFMDYIKQIENVYGQEMSEIEIEIWYNNLKFMSLERFNYILAEIYKTNKFMPKLADILQMHKQIPYTENKEEIKQKCDKCNGTGYIFYTKIIEGKPYQYAAVCDCGRQKRYDGRKVEDVKNRSDYHIPTIAETGLDIKENRPSNEEIVKSMKMLANSQMVSEDIKNIIRENFKKRRVH